MKQLLKTLKTAVVNAVNIRKIVDERIRKQLAISEMSRNARSLDEPGVSEELRDGQQIIVSLTTYSRRIHQVNIVVESLLEQTLKPNSIVLWLDKTEFNGLEDLPLNLLKLVNRGLSIEFCDNLRSYKKLIPALEKYPQAIIITADDDILYPTDFVERLYKAYKKDPRKVHYYRGHRMLMADGSLLPYRNWELEASQMGVSMMNFPTGVGGALYTSELLDDEVMNVDAFMKLAPTADDVWFKAMSLKKGISCSQVDLECPFREKFIFLDAMDDMGLANVNLVQNKNDEQIVAVFDRYKLLDRLSD